MSSCICVKDPIVFLQKMMENAYDQDDMKTVMAMSRRIDSVMLQQIAEETAATNSAM